MFEPMSTGRGVMYKLDWLGTGAGFTKYFDLVGFGPGLRPAEQHAWTFARLAAGRDDSRFEL